VKRNHLVCAVGVFLVIAFGQVSMTGQSVVFKKDPDSTVDLAKVVSYAHLPTLDQLETVAAADTTPAGLGNAVAGLDASAPEPFAPTPSAHTFIVDNTPLNGDCPNANFPTIQAAVDASGPNDTVKVCPGTYAEQVRIDGHVHDGLKLESLQPLHAVIRWPALESFPLALVYFHEADHVTLRGFTVTGPFTFSGCSPDRHEGLLIDDGFDERILTNHITLIRNSVPAFYGCQEGDAVAIGRRTPTPSAASAHIWQNVIDKYQKNGVQAVNAGTFADIDHNVITGSSEVQSIIASNGVVVFRQAAATVAHNAISNNKFTPGPLSTGVILDEAPPGSSTVDHNRIFDNDNGIETDTQSNLEISHNEVSNNLGDGITLCGDMTVGCGAATLITVRQNDIRDNRGSGIALFDADSNLLKANHAERNGVVTTGDVTDGIRVDSLSGDNRILENHMLDNVTHDCHDDSAGGGTGGTANSWINDKGVTENKPGLCTP
jgi:parallel beta-helix repeat protein